MEFFVCPVMVPQVMERDICIPANAIPIHRPASWRTMCKELKDGAIYHSITVGYGIMGAHGGMIRPEDRWKIILHIRENLQKQTP